MLATADLSPEEMVRRMVEANRAATMQMHGLQSEADLEAWYLREQERQRVAAVLATGLPEKFLAATFATSKPTTVVRRMKRYMGTELRHGRALVLAGVVGSGKTWAVACLINAIVPERGVRFWYMPRLVERWHSEERGRVMDSVCRAEVLVLDDLGVEAVLSDLTKDMFDTLFYMRHAKSLATVVTTNLSAEVFTQRYGERVVDRLREWGSWFTVRVPKSLREATTNDRGTRDGGNRDRDAQRSPDD